MNEVIFQGIKLPDFEDWTTMSFTANLSGKINVVFTRKETVISLVRNVNISGQEMGWSLYLGDTHFSFWSGEELNKFFSDLVEQNPI